MKLFSWVQNKLINGKQGSIKTNKCPPSKNQVQQFGGEKEEFSDWPNGFLSIGTLGNKDFKEETKANNVQSHNQTKDLTLDEVRQLHKELTSYMSSSDHHKNLDCSLSSLVDDSRDQNESPSSPSYAQRHNDQLQHSTIIVPNKAKDVYNLDNGAMSKAIGKKSFSFLLKKLIVCGSSGLGPTPSLRDPILTPPTTPRMEKIFRAILQKKIHPSSPRKAMSKKIYLEDGHAVSTNDNNDDDDDEDNDHDDNDEESDEGSEDGSKWVKTDTDYIVLEI